jgi:predicted DCC family thiol-disulfide oxidoreductase YuxK
MAIAVPLPTSRSAAPTAPRATTPPADGAPVALYDGHCSFCTSQALSLARMARGAIVTRDFQAAGVLDAFPGLTHAHCMVELKLVAKDGRIYGGAEAVVRALRLGRPILGRLAMGYYIPGVRQLSNWAYRFVARNRYRLFGVTAAKKGQPACDGDSCAVHFQ